jgi:hypothetical protein
MRRRCQFTVLFLSSFLVCACVVPPLPLTHRTETPNGTKLPDLDFIQVGLTTREQVEQNLPSLDTGATPGMFWGRYNHSVISDPGGSRHWNRTNLIITYDDRGVVKTERREGDDHMNLILRDWLATRPKQNFRTEVRLVATILSHKFSGAIRSPSELVLCQDSFGVIERGPNAKPEFHAPPEKIRRIQSAPPDLCCSDENRANGEIIEQMWIEGPVYGKRPLLVQVSPANMVVLIDYLRQHVPGVKYE